MNSTVALTNPVLKRELLGRLRSGKTLLAAIAIALISSLLVVLRWPSDATMDLTSQGAMLVFRPVAFAIAVGVMMLVPAFPATAIVAERKKGTLALLLNSPTSTWEVYLGKLFGNAILGCILFSASLPAIFACFAMGGVSMKGHVLPLAMVVVAMTLQYSALALWISSQAQSSDASLRWTYGAILGLVLLSIGPSVLVGRQSGTMGYVSQAMATLSPIPALQQITDSQGQSQILGVQAGWLAFVIVALIMAAGLSILTVRRLDPLLLDRARPSGPIIESDELSWWRGLLYVVDPQQRKAGIPFWLNPVMVKEFRTRKFGRLHWLMRLVAAGAIISLVLTVIATTGTVKWGVDRIAASMVIMQIGLLLLLGPTLGANILASEVESGGWQLLRSAPISAWRILIGKLSSVALTLLLLLGATLPGYLMMGYIQPTVSGQVGNVVISLLIATAMITLVSACVSAFSRSTAVATITSYSLLLVLFVGSLLLWLFRGNPFGPVVVENALLLNPAAIALSEIKAPGFEDYALTPRGWYIGLAICAAAMT
ncbi:MAG: ABC transporter permease, partial [Pirellula sp.]|nr:ABC transporter permease [Pirellula sp.]